MSWTDRIIHKQIIPTLSQARFFAIGTFAHFKVVSIQYQWNAQHELTMWYKVSPDNTKLTPRCFRWIMTGESHDILHKSYIDTVQFKDGLVGHLFEYNHQPKWEEEHIATLGYKYKYDWEKRI